MDPTVSYFSSRTSQLISTQKQILNRKKLITQPLKPPEKDKGWQLLSNGSIESKIKSQKISLVKFSKNQPKLLRQEFLDFQSKINLCPVSCTTHKQHTFKSINHQFTNIYQSQIWILHKCKPSIHLLILTGRSSFALSRPGTEQSASP